MERRSGKSQNVFERVAGTVSPETGRPRKQASEFAAHLHRVRTAYFVKTSWRIRPLVKSVKKTDSVAPDCGVRR